jgi:hypothetical protein
MFIGRYFINICQGDSFSDNAESNYYMAIGYDNRIGTENDGEEEKQDY